MGAVSTVRNPWHVVYRDGRLYDRDTDKRLLPGWVWLTWNTMVIHREEAVDKRKQLGLWDEADRKEK